MLIQNKVKNLKTVDVNTFLSWDFNTLKSAEKRDTTKLENAIIKSGWSFPVIVWMNTNNPYVIDGTGRRQAVKNLLEKGYTIKEIPCVEIEAENLTMKPVELFSYQITNNTKGEDIVLDNFLGSGTTLIACQKTGRICYGMELDPKYVDVIIQRYVDYTGNENIKLNGKDIIWKKTEKTL